LRCDRRSAGMDRCHSAGCRQSELRCLACRGQWHFARQREFGELLPETVRIKLERTRMLQCSDEHRYAKN
jgi:hypothetical protein